MLIVAGFADSIIRLVFADGFLPAVTLLQGLMIGGLARLISAPLETVLTVLGHPRKVVAISVTSLVTLLTISMLGYQHLGLRAIAWAYGIANVVHLAALVVSVRAQSEIKLPMAKLIWLAVLTGAGIALIHAPTVTWAVPVLPLIHPESRKRVIAAIGRVMPRAVEPDWWQSALRNRKRLSLLHPATGSRTDRLPARSSRRSASALGSDAPAD